MAGTSDKPDGTPAGPDDINSRLAEIAAELASEARFKEPSAAERARARVTAVGPAAQHVRRRFGRRRARRKAEELRRPVDAVDAPAPPRQLPQRRARRAASQPMPDRSYADVATPSVRRSVIAVIIIVALLVGVSIGLRYLIRHYGQAAPAPRQTASTTPTIKVTSPPPFEASNPFLGSVAFYYQNGPRGIVPPRAARTGSFTASQVGSAYNTVKGLLVAANLTQPALRGASPTAFGSLLTSEQRTALYKSVASAPAPQPARAIASRSWLTVFAPDTGLVGSVIKVNGAPMTAEQVRARGRTALQIQANFVFVYPVQQNTDQLSRVLVVVHVFATVLFARWDDPGGVLEPWVAAMTPYDFNVQCGMADGLVHPLFADLRPGAVQPTGPQVNPFALVRPPQASCYRSTTSI